MSAGFKINFFYVKVISQLIYASDCKYTQTYVYYQLDIEINLL